jgi:nucleoside-diphosphate-sugar epimerase
MDDKKSILITGASGFIGSYVAEEALKRGLDTWVAVRRSTNRKYLQDERLHFIELDLGSTEQMVQAMQGHHWHYVVHAAGATKCKNEEDFYQTNTEGTRHFVEALMASAGVPQMLVFTSSLSVYGACREQQPYQDIAEEDTPQPNTAYGRSKLMAEQALEELARCADPQHALHYVILRPTGVYGPREKDYFLMADSIKKHVDFAVGFKRQDITFVYVQDLVQAIFLALEQGAETDADGQPTPKASALWGRKYFVSDGSVYDSTEFSNLLRKELGNPWMLRVRAPLWLLWIICQMGGFVGRLTGRMSALNGDKYHILKQRNWRCDIGPIRRELGYQPQYPLERGVALAVKWYKENGWL